MSTNHYVLPKRTPVRWVCLVLAVLLAVDAGYTLWAYPSYTKYYDYWAMLAAGVLMAAGCAALPKIRQELMVIPAALVALVGCFSLSTLHWAEIALFFLYLVMTVIRMPEFCATVVRVGGVIAGTVGVWASVMPMAERIERLMERGDVTMGYVVPYVLRGLGSDVPIIAAIVVFLFAMTAEGYASGESPQTDRDFT